MASGNRPVTTEVWISNFPQGLKYIIEDYQTARVLPSFSRAITELLETHPEIVRRVERLYTIGIESTEST